jgi:uncharacterized OsmC-like protein
MNAEELKALQAPIKERYRNKPESAKMTLRATGVLDGDRPLCMVNTFNGETPAGLHPAVGGDGSDACSGNMLLEALVGCAGVTLRAVATAMNIPLRSGVVRVEGDMDFRGTLGVSKETPVGFQAIRLYFDLDTDAPADQVQTLIKLTERYCVVYQTLANKPALTTQVAVSRKR